MARKEYRWRLKIGAASYTVVTPAFRQVWGDKDTITTELESGQMFHRSKVVPSLVFLRDDYEPVYTAPMETEFRLQLQYQSASNTWLLEKTLKFYRTDLKFDTHKRQIFLQSAEVYDLYDEFLAKLDKEYNLIELEPPTSTVAYRKQAILQVYLPGASIIQNYRDGYWFETPVTPLNTYTNLDGTDNDDNHDAMLNDYGFGLGTGYSTPDDGLFNYARFVVQGSGLSPDVSGVYRSTSYSVGGVATPPVFERLDGAYRIENFTPSPGNIRYKITRLSDSTIVYQSEIHAVLGYPIAGQPPHTTPSLTFTSTTSSSTCQGYLFLPYVRLLTDAETVNGDATVELPTDDPFNNGTFKRALPIDTLNFEYSFTASTTATQWGKVAAEALYFQGRYFVKPTVSGQFLMPLMFKTWTGASAWFYMDDELRGIVEQAGSDITLKDAYKLSDVIYALLRADGSSSLFHTDSPGNSDFLYGTSNPIRGARKVPVLVPISNILTPDYDVPAKRAMLRMSEVLQLLSMFHNCYPYIGEGVVKIEHYDFFDNGGSYAGEQVSIDLTTLKDTRLGLPVEYGQEVFTYEKQNLPERIEPGWAFDVSFLFQGWPIDVLSTFVQKGSVQDSRVRRFVSDIDYVHVAPDNIPTDVFMFFECIEGEVVLEVPMVEIEISSDEKYKVQNGYAAFAYAHEHYHRHGLPAPNVRLNKAETTATTTKRSRVQELSVSDFGDVDAMKLVKTSFGNARIDNMERKMDGSGVKLKLRHRNED